MTLAIPICLALLAVAPASAGKGKPTREAIVAYLAECAAKKEVANLSARFGHDFASLNLSGVDFKGYWAVGNETVLIAADFTGANLAKTDLSSAMLVGASFRNANLRGATLNHANCLYADFRRATLEDAILCHANLARTDLSGADLSKTHVDWANFQYADLTRARLARREAKGTHGFQTRAPLNFENARLAGADLHGLRLEESIFAKADLRGADLSQAVLTEAEFWGADLAGANLQGTQIAGAGFDQVQGLPESEVRRLQNEAARWRLVLAANFRRLLDDLRLPAYLALAVGAGWLTGYMLRRPRRDGFAIGLALINGWILLAEMAPLPFQLLGMASTVQFNAGSGMAMNLWSEWVGLWILLVGVTLLCLAALLASFAMLIVTRFCRGRACPVRALVFYHFVTLLHGLVAIWWLGQCAPRA